VPNWLEFVWLPLAVGLVVGLVLLFLEYKTGWFVRREQRQEKIANGETKSMAKRKPVPKEIETQVLEQSRRRCCLCFGLDRDLAQKRGQIAHLDGDPSNNTLDNLAYLCIDHHDQYDSRTRQSKGFTIDEVKRYRDQLRQALETTAPPQGAGGESPQERAGLVRWVLQIGRPIIRLLRGDRASHVAQIGSGRIEVVESSSDDREGTSA
jgi:hypothetical protein